MLSAYAPLFRVPGALRFIAGTALSRTGVAGAVSAVGVAVLAIAGPVIGRLVDKHGQRRVALPFILVSSCAGALTAYFSWSDAPVWTLFVFYGLSAVLPEPGPMSRARWAHIFRDDPDQLHTAMSFEQVADEASFVLGPVLAVLVSPRACSSSSRRGPPSRRSCRTPTAPAGSRCAAPACCSSPPPW